MTVETIITGLQLASMAGSCWLGYRSGPYIKRIINTPPVKQYKDKIGFTSSDIINEDMFCSLTGSLVGVCIGRLLWPITIPVVLVIIGRDHGPTIRKFIRDVRKG